VIALGVACANTNQSITSLAIWPYCHMANNMPIPQRSQNTISQLNGGSRIDRSERTSVIGFACRLGSIVDPDQSPANGHGKDLRQLPRHLHKSNLSGPSDNDH
jgi:hypothetical protein